MAIGILFDIPGGTLEQYEELNQKAFGDTKGPAENPSGLIIHTAGATSGGWRIFDAWESKDDFQRFMEEYIMPAAEELGTPAFEPEIYELTNLIGAAVPARTT
jgi:hypothetical protein